MLGSSSTVFTEILRPDRTSSRTLVKLTSVVRVDGSSLRSSSSKFVLPYLKLYANEKHDEKLIFKSLSEGYHKFSLRFHPMYAKRNGISLRNIMWFHFHDERHNLLQQESKLSSFNGVPLGLEAASSHCETLHCESGWRRYLLGQDRSVVSHLSSSHARRSVHETNIETLRYRLLTLPVRCLILGLHRLRQLLASRSSQPLGPPGLWKAHTPRNSHP
ncbi:hypothetical protein J6590_048240 [Homalodisca vitripennis]|nr:hypothetical protein J6590_048240 [Homalodisca vitripennis]